MQEHLKCNSICVCTPGFVTIGLVLVVLLVVLLPGPVFIVARKSAVTTYSTGLRGLYVVTHECIILHTALVSLVPRPCAFVTCSTKFAQRAWARSSCDVCHSRIFTSAQCLPCCLYTCTRKFLVETSQARTIDYSRKL